MARRSGLYEGIGDLKVRVGLLCLMVRRDEVSMRCVSASGLSAVFWALLLASVLGGCTSLVDRSQELRASAKVGSLGSWQSAEIEGQSIARWASVRSVVVAVGMDADAFAGKWERGDSGSGMFGGMGQRLKVRAVRSGEFEVSVGSGVIVSGDGYVLTAAHVINSARLDPREKIYVSYVGGNGELIAARARVVANVAASSRAASEDNGVRAMTPDGVRRVAGDVAILKIEPAGELAAVDWSDDFSVVGSARGLAGSGPRRGTRVLAVGSGTSSDRFSAGVVQESRLVRGNTVPAWYIRLDAPVSKGDSGGPLLNRQGQLVGLINGGLIRDELDRFVSLATLPDKGAIMQLIEADRANRANRLRFGK
jgi:S1-C subfamily serine protease